ncbi:MAG: Rnase Y domain-containing protein [Candidatus Gracilibacteria bacterium]
MPQIEIVFAVSAGLIGLIIGGMIAGKRKFDEKALNEKAKKVVVSAEQESKQIMIDAEIKRQEAKRQFELEQAEFMKQLEKMEQMMSTKNGMYVKRDAKNQEVAKAIAEEERSANGVREQIKELEIRVEDKLLHICGIPKDKTREVVIQNYEQDFLRDAETRLQHRLEWAQECASRDAKQILSEAIYRYAAPTSVEHGHQNITVPRDEIKGLIVGRGGMNIAFFEKTFEVDVIFNDEPNTIIVSCFNLVQRELAKLALERLMRERVINEETILRVKLMAEQDLERILRKEGEKVLKMLGITSAPIEFMRLVGRLKYRTSYGQSILHHCFEVAYFSRILAGEVGANEKVAWIAGFFHDVGKAIDQEQGGSHDVLTKEILEKYGFPKEIVHAAWTHHDAAPQETIEAQIVQAADAISAGRPGARAESVERYLEKIKDLEGAAVGLEGVKKAYAINAGRELRVIVEPEKLTDAGALELAQNIAGKVQEKGGYPGKIRIITIRTTKVTDHAR